MTNKSIITAIFIFLAFNSAFSQRIVDNFIISDLNDNEVNLYEKLDEGKVVIVNMFTVSCIPCVDYEFLSFMDTLWQQYGPDGTDELYIISVESHPETTEFDLFNNSESAFFQNLVHPLSNTDLGGHFDNGYYGRFEICSNKVATEIYTIGNNSIYDYPHFGNTRYCNRDSLNLDAMMLTVYTPSYVNVCENGMYFNPQLTLQNVGIDTIFDLKFMVWHNESFVDSMMITDEITQNEMRTFFLPEILMDSLFSYLEVDITEVNSQTGDDNLTNNSIFRNAFMRNENYEHIVNDSLIRLRIATGKNGHEIYWALLNEEEEIVFEGGNIEEVGLQGGGANNATPGNGYENDTTYWENMILPTEGCYEFVFVDNGGNITPNGSLYYQLYSPDTTQITRGKGAKYASFDKRQIEYSTIINNVENRVKNQMVISPNPVKNGTISITFSSKISGSLSYEIFSLNGQLIAENINLQGGNSFEINLPNLAQGLYLIKVKNGQSFFTEKIMVSP